MKIDIFQIYMAETCGKTKPGAALLRLIACGLRLETQRIHFLAEGFGFVRVHFVDGGNIVLAFSTHSGDHGIGFGGLQIFGQVRLTSAAGLRNFANCHTGRLELIGGGGENGCCAEGCQHSRR